jgi:hypothetical protein
MIIPLRLRAYRVCKDRGESFLEEAIVCLP